MIESEPQWTGDPPRAFRVRTPSPAFSSSIGVSGDVGVVIGDACRLFLPSRDDRFDDGDVDDGGAGGGVDAISSRERRECIL